MIPTMADEVRTASPGQQVDAALRGLKTLATAPHAALKITRMVDDAGSTVEDLERLISSDLSLCARVLKVVNSSYYGVSSNVDSIHQAIVFLGFEAVKNIAIASCFDKFFSLDRSVSGFSLPRLWTHSMAVANAAQELSRMRGNADAKQAFIAGLLHDIGIIVELQVYPGPFAEAVCRVTSGECRSLRDAEMKTIGATHDDFGQGLCRKWKFPMLLQSVVGFHHQPADAPREYQSLTEIVHLADLLAVKFGKGLFAAQEHDCVERETVESLGLSSTEYDLIGAVLEQAADSPL